MGLIDIASYASTLKGYEYYKENRVLSIKQIEKTSFEGRVSGSANEPYLVHIDILHPRKSSCSCPFTAGNRKVCKHMIALYFMIFPDKAEEYYDNFLQDEYDNEPDEYVGYSEDDDAYDEYYDEEYADRIYMIAGQKIMSMKKQELQDALFRVLIDSPKWVLNRFIKDYIDC